MRDALLEFGEAGFELLALQGREPRQPHVQDRVGLDLAQPEPLLKSVGRFGPVVRRADDPDDLVDVVERRDEPLDHVPLGLGLLQIVPAPPLDHLEAVIAEALSS